MLQKKRKRRRLGASANSCDRRRAEHKDHVWAWDFVFDHTTSGSQLKWLSIVDEHTRECLALKVDRSITSEDVIDTLAELFAMRECLGVFAATMARSLSPVRFAIGWPRWTWRRSTLSRAVRGRTATPRASTAGSAMSSWRWEIFEQPAGCPRVDGSLEGGLQPTADRMGRWATRPPPSSRRHGLCSRGLTSRRISVRPAGTQPADLSRQLPQPIPS